MHTIAVASSRGTRILLSATSILLIASGAVIQAASWTPTGSMAVAREGHSLTLLADGRVLAAGGTSGFVVALSSAEIYDPDTGTWSAVGSMGTPRLDHQAALLPDGRVLVMGGHDRGVAVATAEIFDPSTGTWSPGPRMRSKRYYFTSTTLPDGKVLVAGGCSRSYCERVTATAELFDPASGTWSLTGKLKVARDYHTATRLADGRVLVTGGYSTQGTEDRTEIYDPASGTWSMVAKLTTKRSLHEAVLLPTGQVLVAEGQSSNGAFLNTAEVYTPSTNAWTSAGTLADSRQYFTMTTLLGGTALVSAGLSRPVYSAVPIPEAEAYDPLMGTWSPTATLKVARSGHRAVLLPDGRVLVSGGIGLSGYLRSAELFLP